MSLHDLSYSADVLLERLTDGVRHSARPVTFLVGAALSAPCPADSPGVPPPAGVIELIRAEFQPPQLNELDSQLTTAENQYQTAFRFLHGRRGPEATDSIIKRATWKARRPTIGEELAYAPSASTKEEFCRLADDDSAGWHLSPSHIALGHLAASEPGLFGTSILTTNFDPLIEVAIKTAGGSSLRTVLHRDGDLGQTKGVGTHVVHLHGYWHGSDTLHSPRQLLQDRPRLKASLYNLIAGHTLVVIGYGGWDDIFTQALMEVVLDDHASPDIVWTFFNSAPHLTDKLLTKLTPGVDRGRVTFYSGVDCNDFLPKLAAVWSPNSRTVIAPCQSAASHPKKDEKLDNVPRIPEKRIPYQIIRFDRTEQDHPPTVEFYVGRSVELAQLRASDHRILHITGIGGSGKSALAAHYLEDARSKSEFDHYIWRDCKEESERFERQLVSIVTVLADGAVSERDLATQPIESITELLLELSTGIRLLVIFDNVDHYIDLEHLSFTGSVAKFCTYFSNRSSDCRVVFTCRPAIEHAHYGAFSLRLEGITLDDAFELFRLRNARADESAIKSAHGLTRGHAFWLNLLAAQLARRGPDLELADLLKLFDTDTPELPTAMLRSIWSALKDRERLVLQALAETVKPTPVLRLADYLESKMRYNQLYRAINSLKGLNLLVVKASDSGYEQIELHPLVRTFVRRNFPKLERDWFIHAILNVYKSLFGLHQLDLKRRPAVATIEHWSEGAELHIAAGEYAHACACLHQISDVVQQLGSPAEFLRVVRILFHNANWKTLAKTEHFDSVISAYIELQSLAGKIDECTEALEGYASTLQGKEARYINYCSLRCYMHWVNGDFVTAIKWGTEGVDLKERSNVDTKYDCAHNLALARRDAGIVDPALEYFLEGATLSEAVEESSRDSTLGGTYYGNVGRCLQLMGQIEPALACYKKSAFLLDTLEDTELANRAYIRQWVGELLVSKGELQLGLSFLEAARQRWSMLSPPKVRLVSYLIEVAATGHPYVAEPDQANEGRWKLWVER